MNADACGFLDRLDAIVADRLTARSEASYTYRLAQSGPSRVAQKVGEEAVELILAAATGTRAERIGEAADLLYHLLVLLHTHDLSLADVTAELERRHSEAS